MKLKTETENGFKQTEIGSIPEDWETAKINEAYGFTKKLPRIDLSKYKRIPFIPMEFVPDDGKDLNRYEFREKVSSGTFVCKGDLIVAKITPSFENGKQAIVRDIPFDFVYATTEVWPIHEIEGQSDIDYLFYYLKKPDVRNDVAGKMEGSTGRQRVPKNVLENLTIPLPTLKEQQKIASVLSKIQQAIEQQDKIIEKTKELKRSLMHRLFTYGLRGEELKETEIGLMPESWEIVEVGELGEIITGTTPPTKNKEYYTGGSYQFISPFDLGNTKYAYKTEKEISSKGLSVSRCLPKDAVLVVCIGSTIGKVGMTSKDKSATNQQINTIVCDKKYNPHFVYYCLLFKSEYIRSLATPSPVPIMSKGKFQKAVISIPANRDEQDKIVEILSAIDEKSREGTIAQTRPSGFI